MKKIVINSCFGGFSLSNKAVKRMAELQGRECYFFTNPTISGDYVPSDINPDDLFITAFDIPNPNEVLKSQKEWRFMSAKERAESSALYRKHSIEERDIKRDNPILIQVVEELGKEANGRCASLKIVEIPDDIEWIIEEYDGSEHIAESHKTWS